MKTWGSRACGLALTVCVSSLLAVTGALAADLYTKPGLKDGPYVPPALWQGLYLGGHVGGAWDTNTAQDHYNYVGDPEARNNVTGSGVIAGGQIGYNFQWGNIVFGPEADLGYLGLAGSKSVALPISPDCTGHPYPASLCGLNANYSSSGGLYGDITGRLGYAAGPTLFYAKGGVAFLDADFKADYTGQNCLTAGTCTGAAVPSKFNFNKSDTLWGWTVGAGAEYALSQAWSLKLEYQHFDFGSFSLAHNGDFYLPGHPTWYSRLGGSVGISPTVDAVMVGMNYHLNLVSALK